MLEKIVYSIRSFLWENSETREALNTLPQKIPQRIIQRLIRAGKASYCYFPRSDERHKALVSLGSCYYVKDKYDHHYEREFPRKLRND